MPQRDKMRWFPALWKQRNKMSRQLPDHSAVKGWLPLRFGDIYASLLSSGTAQKSAEALWHFHIRTKTSVQERFVPLPPFILGSKVTLTFSSASFLSMCQFWYWKSNINLYLSKRQQYISCLGKIHLNLCLKGRCIWKENMFLSF